MSADSDRIIQDVARRTREYGKSFEENLRGKERANPDYAFLFDEKASETSAQGFYPDTPLILDRFLSFTSTSSHSIAGIEYPLRHPRNSKTR